MLKDALQTKRCILVCGGGGVGKTTMAASIALAATHFRKRVLVVTIDPAKRLAEAFGYEVIDLEKSGAPLLLSKSNADKLEVPEGAALSVGILNPKYVLDEILEQVLEPAPRERLKKTLLFSQLSEMIYGLQEYTAYEWVTRMLKEDRYDLIVLDTPPAFHAKDFFNAPEKINRLMESRVFHLFTAKKKWFSGILSFTWLEKLLGQRVYQESRVFFETFALLRDRILERCALLSQFFAQQEVEVIAVATPESSALHELEGLSYFLSQKSIPLHTIILNQVEEINAEEKANAENAELSPQLKSKLIQLAEHQKRKSEHALMTVSTLKELKPKTEILTVGMVYAEDGFEILRQSAQKLFNAK